MSPFKYHIKNIRVNLENFPRRFFKDRGDMGRGCIFGDPPYTLLVHSSRLYPIKR